MLRRILPYTKKQKNIIPVSNKYSITNSDLTGSLAKYTVPAADLPNSRTKKQTNIIRHSR